MPKETTGREGHNSFKQLEKDFGTAVAVILWMGSFERENINNRPTFPEIFPGRTLTFNELVEVHKTANKDSAIYGRAGNALYEWPDMNLQAWYTIYRGAAETSRIRELALMVMEDKYYQRVKEAKEESNPELAAVAAGGQDGPAFDLPF